MKVKELTVYNHQAKACAKMLLDAFPERYSKSTAKDEILRLLRGENHIFMVLEEDEVIGFAGSMRHRYPVAHELYPMVIRVDKRYKGVGKRLLDIIEHRLKDMGVVTLYFGTDIEGCRSSLSGEDLYENFFEKLENIDAISHPFLFYRKQGYSVVGAIPDALDHGHPDIIMAKRLTEKKSDS